jgi:hypothetical protein
LYGEALQYVLDAKLDGKAVSREEQLALASRFMAVRHEGRHMAELNVTEVLNGRT